ncbi:MAG: ABC transporter permease [Acidobacteriota bacterium]|nr:ABC transporter permease [Acidobacteriota bacterium]
MSGPAIVRLIAGREIAERLQGRLVRWMTAATALVVVAGVTIPGLIQGGVATTRVGLAGGSAQALAPTLARTAAAAKAKIAIRDLAGEAQARRELRNGRLDVALTVGPSSAQVEVKQALSPTTRAVLQGALDAAHFRQAIARAGLPLAKVLPALTPVPLRSAALEPVPADKAARAVAAIAAGLIMYISLALYGGAVATGVAQEKTSRTAEVLLAAVRPGQLLIGKVTGIGLVGLAQLSIAVLAGFIANTVVHSTRIPASVWVLLPTFLVFFLTGFLLYAFAFAAAGALVARQEEVQFVTTPLALPLLIGYLLIYAAVASPNAAWLKVVSFLPPLSPALMPARIALGHIAWWEPPIDALVMLASLYAMVRLASRVYANALIHGGERLSWRAALRLREKPFSVE